TAEVVGPLSEREHLFEVLPDAVVVEEPDGERPPEPSDERREEAALVVVLQRVVGERFDEVPGHGRAAPDPLAEGGGEEQFGPERVLARLVAHDAAAELPGRDAIGEAGPDERPGRDADV